MNEYGLQNIVLLGSASTVRSIDVSINEIPILPDVYVLKPKSTVTTADARDIAVCFIGRYSPKRVNYCEVVLDVGWGLEMRWL